MKLISTIVAVFTLVCFVSSISNAQAMTMKAILNELGIKPSNKSLNTSREVENNSWHHGPEGSVFFPVKSSPYGLKTAYEEFLTLVNRADAVYDKGIEVTRDVAHPDDVNGITDYQHMSASIRVGSGWIDILYMYYFVDGSGFTIGITANEDLTSVYLFRPKAFN